MTFRDDTEALRHRVELLESELEEARRARDTAIEERDRARREAAESEAERALRLSKSARFAPGAPVLVEWGQRWWDATVIEVKGPSLFRIHYDGWSASWDEDVGTSRILPRDARPPGPRGGRTSPLTLGIVVGILFLFGIFFMMLDHC